MWANIMNSRFQYWFVIDVISYLLQEIEKLVLNNPAAIEPEESELKVHVCVLFVENIDNSSCDEH